MSRNTEKIRKALLDKGIDSPVFWTRPGKTDGIGIEGYYAEKVQGMRYYSAEHGREISHSGWLGDSMRQAMDRLTELPTTS